MRLVFTEAAWEDYLWLQKNNPKLLKRTNKLLKEVMRTPTSGLGKPERLKADLSGYWSRRIDAEHRLVYGVGKQEIIVIACRFHYHR